MQETRRSSLLLAVSIVLAVAACGNDAVSAPTTTAPSPTTDVPTTTTTTVVPTTTVGATTSTTPTTTGAPTTTSGAGLPGERIEIFPYEDAELAVVGVAADDTLNVRSGPGVEFDVVTELDPLATDIVATGHNRQIDSGAFWSEITTGAGTGWANTSFLLHPGRTTDDTAALYPTPADRPGAETMLELGQIVAEVHASDVPPSEIVVVDGPSVGDLGEITIDVLGLGDDSLGGVRLHVFAEPLPDGETFQVRTVETTLLCTRGVADDGFCV